MESCLCEEGGMSMEPIQGFTGVYGEEAWSRVRARRAVWAWTRPGAPLACMEKKQRVVSVRGGRYGHGTNQGFTSVYGEETDGRVGGGGEAGGGGVRGPGASDDRVGCGGEAGGGSVRVHVRRVV